MGNVSALRERPFFMSIELTLVLLCSFVFKIMMGLRNAKHLFAASERGLLNQKFV